MKSVDPFAPSAPVENTLVPELGAVSKTSRAEAGKFDALLAKAHGVEAKAKTPANSNAKALPGTQLSLPEAGKQTKAAQVDTQIELPTQGRSIHGSITRTTRALPEAEAAQPQTAKTAKKEEAAKLDDTDTLALRFDDDEVDDDGRLQAVLSQVATVVARIVVPKGDKPAAEQLVKVTAAAAKSVALPAVQEDAAHDGQAFAAALDTQIESDEELLSPSTNIDGTDEHTVAAQAATSSVPPGHSLPPLTASEVAALPGLAGRTRAAGMVVKTEVAAKSADAQVAAPTSDKGVVPVAKSTEVPAPAVSKLHGKMAPVASAAVAPVANGVSAPAASAPAASAPVASAPAAAAPAASAPAASAPVAAAPASATVENKVAAPARSGVAQAPSTQPAGETTQVAPTAQGVPAANVSATQAPQVDFVVKGAVTPPQGAQRQLTTQADAKTGEARKEPMERINGFTRGALAGTAFSAYSGRAQTADKEGGTSQNRAEVEDELEDLETKAEGKAELDKLIAAPEQAAATQIQPTMVEAQRLDLPVPVPAVPVPQAPLQTPEVEFAARPPGSQTEAASISIHHPDLGPIQLEVHRDHGRVEVHAVLESVHAEAVLRANESGIRQGVQQSGMSFSALRVRVRGEEQPTARPAQTLRRRRANSEK